ncbi:hypothetical protein [Corallibacter sp.]|uniref:hypothetical protein n=1 Tax=Corallibacter sp. TaxID=2038084 RepID=UPI003AB138A2
MKKVMLIVLILVSFPIKVLAQSDLEKKNDSKDPLDVSNQKEQVQKYGVLTISKVEEMKNNADALYESESWEEAASAYETYAKKINWLANLLSQCVEPYYSASYDDRKATSYSTLKQFIPFESKANEYKRSRNIAYVKIGLCYKNLGDIENAVIYLHQGLDLLDVKQVEYWKLATNAMAEILNFTPSN